MPIISLHLLTDLGSTYNVLDSKVARAIREKLKPIVPTKITVVNGQKVTAALFVKT